ncbi:MAG: Hpt domain-containing protein, partial [Phycisphaerae bacterium]|nr:Hpt domain-containing protein [Phycisphaerae bacterium]
SAVLRRFVERLPQRVTEILQCLQTGNSAELLRLVHQIKGAAGGYGFPQITEQASRTEALLKSQSPFDQVQREARALVELIRRVEGYPTEMSASAQVRRKILLAHTCPRIRELASLAADELSAELLLADDSQSARDLAIRHVPDGILLDANLGGENGFAIRRSLARHERTAGIPVMLITRGKFIRTEDCGLEEFDRIAHPADESEMRREINELLNRRSLRDTVRHRSRIDSLTGMPNELFLAARMPADLSAARRQGLPFSIYCLRLLSLASLGAAGSSGAADAVVKEIARVLGKFFEGRTVARNGPDEFCAAEIGVDYPGAVERSEELRRVLAGVQLPDGGAVDVAIGVATATAQSASVTELLEEARASISAPAPPVAMAA